MKRISAQQKLYNDKWMMRHAYGHWHKLASRRLRIFTVRMRFPCGIAPKGHWVRERANEVDQFLSILRTV